MTPPTHAVTVPAETLALLCEELEAAGDHVGDQAEPGCPVCDALAECRRALDALRPPPMAEHERRQARYAAQRQQWAKQRAQGAAHVRP